MVVVFSASKKRPRSTEWQKIQCLVGMIVCLFLVGLPIFLMEVVQTSHFLRVKTATNVMGIDVRPVHDLHHPNMRSIMEGKYFLIDIAIKPGALSADSDDGHPYGTVSASFCPIDWRLQKKNPSSVPMFRDLIQQSRHCNPNRVNLDLRKVVNKTRHYDGTLPKINKPKSLKIGGFVFHESRCGSTLVANLLSAAVPEQHRVYSEPGPPLAVVRACESQPCNKQKQQQLLKDVLYLMGRSAAKWETHVFYKIQSVGVKSIRTFTRAFPATPWIFVYRDGIETMMSHLKKSSDTIRANCLRSYDNPPKVLTKLVQESGREMESLSRPEFCAAHLATLCDAAINEFTHSQDDALGRFVNYQNLPDLIWESVLPNHFNVANDLDIDNMRNAASLYSKNRGDPDKEEWKDDSMYKQNRADADVRAAAQSFLKQRYDTMESLSLETTQ